MAKQSKTKTKILLCNQTGFSDQVLAQNLIPPIHKLTYAPDVEPSNLISDEGVFQALTGIDWATIDFQPLGGEEEGEPAQGDLQTSHQAEEES